ncbi:fumarylacetoacetase [Phytohabitans rumicis]|uniref:fumarylacetoacetase n=1 Tax=Phytohabitans rumicis TaxID=1076125 RepID=A0A6V8KRQ7_9ACTN|nr:fumarylacetoacetase [Phytohabitans rumicis]GFJ87812.1 fumarylacetoacetase [Phytohabitans rumicis]
MTWASVPPGSDFPVENLPYGVFSADGRAPRVGVAIGDHILDLAPVLDEPVFAEPTLNRFLGQGRRRWQQIRNHVTDLLTDPAHRPVVQPHLLPQASVTMHMPFEVADYVDFYASVDHATNLGRIFRPDQEPLTPNWRWLPIGYHGRAGTVVASGTPVTRPCGQCKRTLEAAPAFGPSERLDIEAELGFVVGMPSELGKPVPIDRFRDHVFGVVLVNDWSARDMQAWEYVPLGPFLGKSFATSVSPWVIPLDALDAAMVTPPPQQPQPLPYLRDPDVWGLDIELEVRLNGHVVSRPPYRAMYWTPAQMLAHMTVNGASLRTGDLFASGTISGPDRTQRGSFIELSWNGAEPFDLADGTTRTFLQDGDHVAIAARAPARNGVSIGFGEVTGAVSPAQLDPRVRG